MTSFIVVKIRFGDKDLANKDSIITEHCFIQGLRRSRVKKKKIIIDSS